MTRSWRTKETKRLKLNNSPANFSGNPTADSGFHSGCWEIRPNQRLLRTPDRCRRSTKETDGSSHSGFATNHLDLQKPTGRSSLLCQTPRMSITPPLKHLQLQTGRRTQICTSCQKQKNIPLNKQPSVRQGYYLTA